VQLRIEVSSDAGNLAVSSLYRWLLRDPDARRDATVSLDADASDGAMGSLDIINVVLTQATSIASLAVAIASWRDSRSKPASIKITVCEQTVSLKGDSAKMTDSISQLLSSH
jgi:hypothetical protein